MKKNVFLLVVLILLISVDAYSQCAMCKAVLESETNEVKISGGINSGILFLMGIPYLLIGLAALYYFKFRSRSEA